MSDSRTEIWQKNDYYAKHGIVQLVVAQHKWQAHGLSFHCALQPHTREVALDGILCLQEVFHKWALQRVNIGCNLQVFLKCKSESASRSIAFVNQTPIHWL